MVSPSPAPLPSIALLTTLRALVGDAHVLTADGGAELLDRVRIAVAFRSDPGSACRIDHSRAPAIAARRAESLAGCVSPVDARYASPFARKSAETGQIS